MSERRRLDRLLLPRMRSEPEVVDQLIPESNAPLPRWQTLPLDSKFPVPPAAKGEVTFVTTKICQPAYISTQRENFDLRDPYNTTFQIEYQPLCDPHLKDWLSKPHVRKQLIEQKLLTPSGNVTCTVRDFNNYRKYMRQQALMKSTEPDPFTRAIEKRKMMLHKTKVKAELLSAGVKCKGLKAQQMLKEVAEEKQRQFLKKQATEDEREQKRLEEEKKAHSELVMKRQVKWMERQNEIKKRQDDRRIKSEMKVRQVELEAKQKLNIIDHMRQQKQCELDLKRKEKWQQKCQHQMKALEETRRQQERVEVDMSMGRRQYEIKMMKKKHDTSLDKPKMNTEINRKTSGINELGTIPMSQVVQDTLRMLLEKPETGITLSRRTSLWILEEALYSCGHIEDLKLLKNLSSPQEYSKVLDKLIGSSIKRNFSASVLGEEQDILSKIIHLMVRQLKKTYSDQTHGLPNQEMKDVKNDYSTYIKRVFADVDDSLVTEKAAYVNMCAIMDTKSKLTLIRNFDLERNEKCYPIDQRSELLANHLRLSENEARQMESEMTKCLASLQIQHMTRDQERAILKLFLNLSCNEPISVSEHCRRMDKRDGERSFLDEDNRMTPHSPRSNGWPVAEFEALMSESRYSFKSCQENVMSDRSAKETNVATNNVDTYSTEDVWDESCGRQLHQQLTSETLPDTYLFATTTEEEVLTIAESEYNNDKYNETEDNDHEIEAESQMSENASRKTRSNQQLFNYSHIQTNSSYAYADNSNETSNINRTQTDNSLTQIDNEADIQESSNLTGFSTRDNCEVTDNSNLYPNKNCVNDKQQEVTHNNLNEELSLSSNTTESSTVIISATTVGQTGEESMSLFTKTTCAANMFVSSLQDETELSTFSCMSEERVACIECSHTLDEAVTTAVRLSTENTHENNMTESCQVCSGNIEELHFQKKDIAVLFPSSDEKSNTLSVCDDQAKIEGNVVDDLEEDIVTRIGQFLMKVQQRQLDQVVGFPPSKIHFCVATSLSRMWQPDLRDDVPVFGEWLDNNDAAATIRSLVFNVKIMRFPTALLKNLRNSMATTLLHSFIDCNRCIPDGVFQAIIYQFLNDLEKGQVSTKLLNEVIITCYQVYAEYLKQDQSFMFAIFLYETLSKAESYLSTGKVTNSSFAEYIFPDNLPTKADDTLICSHWKTLLNQAKAVIQLTFISPLDMSRLEKVVVTSCERVFKELDSPDNVLECIEKIIAEDDEDLKMQTDVTLSANVVAVLLQTMKGTKVRNMTLLSGTATLQCSAMPSKLDHSSTGEALVLLILDSLVKDMGEDTLDRSCLGQLAASLVEIFTFEYNHMKEAMGEHGLAGVLECMTSRFRCKSLVFSDSCKIMSAILNPYAKFLLMEDKDVGPKLQLDRALSVDEDLLSSFFNFITEVFVSFVSGVIVEIRNCGFGTDLHDDHLVLIVWRSLADLAKEAKTLLSDQYPVKCCSDESATLTQPNSYLLEGIVDTLTDNSISSYPSKSTAFESTIKTQSTAVNTGPNDTDFTGLFLAAILQQFPYPGYMPVTDYSISQQTRNSGFTTMTWSTNLSRYEPTVPEVEKAARIQIIVACKQICESLVTGKALDQLNMKRADYFACTTVLMQRFICGLHNKILTLKDGLQNGSIAATNMIPLLVTDQQHTLPEVRSSEEKALTIVTEVFLELESVQRSVAMLCKMIESLSKISQGMTQLNVHANNILSVIPDTTVTLFVRSLFIFTFRVTSWLLDGLCLGELNVPMQNPVTAYDVAITTVAFSIVNSEIQVVSKWTEKETTSKNTWTPKINVKTVEDSVRAFPVKIRDIVFGRIVEIMKSSGVAADDDFINEPHSPSDLIAIIINQLLNAVMQHAEMGAYPFIRVNDLLRNGGFTTTGRPEDITNSSSNCLPIRSKMKIKNPLSALEEDESDCLLRQLIHIMAGINNILKEQINTAVRVNESYDSLLRASAMMEAKLGKVKNDLTKKTVILTSIHQCDALKTSKMKTLETTGHMSRNGGCVTRISTESGTVREKMSISCYIEKIFKNMAAVEGANDPLFENQVQIVNEVLKSCYIISPSYLYSDTTAVNSHIFNPVTILLVEAIIAELYNSLDEVNRARKKELDKGINYPYLFSRVYTTPDPWGPYYSEVAVRARQLSDTVKSVVVIRNKCNSISDESSLTSNREETMIPEECLVEDGVSRVLLEKISSKSGSANDSRNLLNTTAQTRISTWRRKVKDNASVHRVDNTIKSWMKNDTQLISEQAEFKTSKRSSSFERQGKVVNRCKHNPRKSNENEYNNMRDHCQRLSLIDVNQIYCKSQKNAQPLTSNLENSTDNNLATSSKQQNKLLPEKCKELLALPKGKTGKTCWKINQAAEQRHVSRINRTYNSIKQPYKCDNTTSKLWPRMVHIVHHSYAENPNVAPVDEPGEKVEDTVVNMDYPSNNVSHEELPKLQNGLIPDEASVVAQDVDKDELGYVCTRLLLSLLSQEMPSEAAIVCRFFCTNSTETPKTEDVVEMISVLDLAMIELDHGDAIEATRLLNGKGRSGKVSQRVAGAINKILRSLLNNLINNDQMQDLLSQTGKVCNNLNIQNIRQELIARLSDMAERVEEGCKLRDIFSSYVDDVLSALLHVKETQLVEAASHDDSHVCDNYETNGENIHEQCSCEKCRVDSNSQTPSCNTAHQSVSVSDVDSNDDKCIMSSSWTILTSCPSLSSSRSSNAANGIKTEYADECCEEMQNNSEQNFIVACDCMNDEHTKQRVSKTNIHKHNPLDDSHLEEFSMLDTVQHEDVKFSEESSRTESECKHNKDLHISGCGAMSESTHNFSAHESYSEHTSDIGSDVELNSAANKVSTHKSYTSVSKASRRNTVDSTPDIISDSVGSCGSSDVSISSASIRYSHQSDALAPNNRKETLVKNCNEMTESSPVTDIENINNECEVKTDACDQSSEDNQDVSEILSQAKRNHLKVYAQCDAHNGVCSSSNAQCHPHNGVYSSSNDFSASENGDDRCCSTKVDNKRFTDLRGGGDVNDSIVGDHDD